LSSKELRMAYADYKFYSEVFHGTMSEADFARFAEPASAYIDAATFDRITPELLADENIGGKIRRACCACADDMYSCGRAADVKSETVGSYSVTYGDRSQAEVSSARYNAVKIYLGNVYAGGVKLMFRGCG
jgi:hypothetical protein